jgi:pyruvate carboxylase subunit A
MAVAAARYVGYESAGTVEFLLSGEDIYFMEMNTRIQVEHTITEQITGVDIVREQIRVAEGKELSYKQEDISYRGYAMQFRINAEDPKNDFLPSFGRITHYYAPGGPGVRVDTAIYTGYEIPPYYDSMCLKLVVWALTWEEVIARGQRAIDDMRLHGIRTTAAYYKQILAHESFRQREFDTSFVPEHPELLNYSDKRHPSEVALALAAAVAAYSGW